MMIVFIIGTFNSLAFTSSADFQFKSNNKILFHTRVVESYARKKPSVCKTIGVWGRIVILALDTTKAPDGVTSSHVLTIDCWQTINLDKQNDCPCQFGVEFLILWTCTKVVRQLILVENTLHSLILQKHWC